MERSLDRRVFENAINTMIKYGVGSVLSAKIYPRREELKESLLKYYESTEEFEKCKFVKDFFDQIERKVSENKIFNQIVGATGDSISDIVYEF